MIAQLSGRLVSTSPLCIVNVGGIGFELQVPEKDRIALTGSSGEVFFHTYLYVREDRLVLFGFTTREDRELFTRLIDVSGIGPRSALSILGEHSTERVVRAIKAEDHGFLCKLPGIGRKTAERLTVDLKDKLDDLSAAAPAAVEGPSALRAEAVLALTALGMSKHAAERAIDGVDWNESDLSVERIVKDALKQASRAGTV